VVDVNNTSGFFPDQNNGVVAISTLGLTVDNMEQSQHIAYSYDGGYTFIKYSGNPVLSTNSTQFRDPKVIWHEPTQKWVMVVMWAQDYVVGCFTSDNLREWSLASNFTRQGWLGFQYECPNLVRMPMEGSDEPVWLLWISINPGAPLGGSVTEYFPGDFNGTHFTRFDQVTRFADFVKDNYAGQFFYGIPGDQPQISIEWASNWQYTNYVSSGDLEGWRSAMSLPRVNYLVNVSRAGFDLVNMPYLNLAPVLGEGLASNSSLNNGAVTVDYSSVAPRALYFEANVTDLTETTSMMSGSLNFTFISSISNESVSGGTTIGGDTWIDRGDVRGFVNPYFTNKFSSTGTYGGDGTWRISGVIDRTILEVFCQWRPASRDVRLLSYRAAGCDDTLIPCNVR